MADEQTQVEDQFQAFREQRKGKTSVAMQDAQKLINLYRALHVFGPEFRAEYNAQLLNVSDAVNAALSGLVGGEEVRQYIEFVKEQNHMEDAEEKSGSSKGYLPDPSQDLKDNAGSERGDYVSRSDFEAFVNDQNKKLKEMMEELRAEQSATLARLMGQLGGGQPKAQPVVSETSSEYSEIIEEPK